jgi:GNAT superfamily N-acetyltransferase
MPAHHQEREGPTGSATSRGHLPRLIAAWVHGWAVSRSVPKPVVVGGGWRIDVGTPGHRIRYVLQTPDDQTLADLGRREAAPGTWIKVAADPTDLENALPDCWTMADTGYLMTTSFIGVTSAPSLPYTSRVSTDGDVAVATFTDATGHIAASGRMAAAGNVGVIDQVETSPAHRRRGLGSAIMRTLGHHAHERGMHTGVLVATDDGRELYRTLGWTVHSPIAAAYVPESPEETA